MTQQRHEELPTTGATASNITGGEIYVYVGGTVQVPADVKLTDAGDGLVFFNGADQASFALVITLRGGELIRS